MNNLPVSLYSNVIGGLFLVITILSEINLRVTLYQMRAREFAVMESVGMTKKDIEKIIKNEGRFQGIFTMILTIFAFSFIMICIGSASYSGEIPFQVVPIFVIILILLVYWIVWSKVFAK